VHAEQFVLFCSLLKRIFSSSVPRASTGMGGAHGRRTDKEDLAGTFGRLARTTGPLAEYPTTRTCRRKISNTPTPTMGIERFGPFFEQLSGLEREVIGHAREALLLCVTHF
jgi:hypothetical protein